MPCATETSPARIENAGLLCIILVILGLPTVAHPQVYKWVDDKGVTQYGSSPPPGTNPKRVTAPPASGNNPTPGKSWQEKEIEFRERRGLAEENRRKEEAEQAEARRNAALRRQSCISARNDLESLHQQRPIYSLDERGERRYLDDKDRPQMMERLRGVIARDCPN